MASKTEICNMAISHLGIGKPIGNVDTEQSSEEANVCRVFFNTAVEATLRDFAFPFAKTIYTLNLVTTNPDDEWSYSYQYPNTALNIVRVLSGIRNDNRQTRVPFKIRKAANGKLIYCDIENAKVEMVERVLDPSFYSSDFVLALSYRLAHYIAPRLTAGDPFNIRKTVFDLYRLELEAARTNSLNEEQSEENPVSEFERSRA